jgi:hypothetical protein
MAAGAVATVAGIASRVPRAREDGKARPDPPDLLDYDGRRKRGSGPYVRRNQRDILDMLAALARKDYADHRRRQA